MQADDTINSNFYELGLLVKHNDMAALDRLVNLVAIQVEVAKKNKLYEQLAGLLKQLRQDHPSKAQELYIADRKHGENFAKSLIEMSQNVKISDLDLISEVNRCLKAFPETTAKLLGDFSLDKKPAQHSRLTFGNPPPKATMRSSVKTPVILAMLAAEINKAFTESNPTILHIKRLLESIGSTVNDQYGIKIADNIAPRLYTFLLEVVGANPNQNKYQKYLNMLSCAIDRSFDPHGHTISFTANIGHQTTIDEDADLSGWVNLAQ